LALALAHPKKANNSTIDQLHDQRDQGPRIRPPFAPWVQGGAGVGWMWSGGPTWPLGRWVRWPVTPTGTGTGAGSSAPPPYRYRYRRLPAAGRGLRPRVFSAHRPGPQLQVHAPASGIRHGALRPIFWQNAFRPWRSRRPAQAHKPQVTYKLLLTTYYLLQAASSWNITDPWTWGASGAQVCVKGLSQKKIGSADSPSPRWPVAPRSWVP
jgi:hypothetical protein